jgi:hypothetical protein
MNARWCEVDFLTFESKVAPNVHVLGDSIQIAPGMPKSGHMANQHGKTCAAAVVAILSGADINQLPVYNNTCYSFVSATEVVHVASVHTYDAGRKPWSQCQVPVACLLLLILLRVSTPTHGPEIFGLTCWFKSLNHFRLHQIKKSASADFFIYCFIQFYLYLFGYYFSYLLSYFLFLVASSNDFKKANFSLILASKPRSVG